MFSAYGALGLYCGGQCRIVRNGLKMRGNPSREHDESVAGSLDCMVKEMKELSPLSELCTHDAPKTGQEGGTLHVGWCSASGDDMGN
jgi:hypothetical protein